MPRWMVVDMMGRDGHVSHRELAWPAGRKCMPKWCRFSFACFVTSGRAFRGFSLLPNAKSDRTGGWGPLIVPSRREAIGEQTVRLVGMMRGALCFHALSKCRAEGDGNQPDAVVLLVDRDEKWLHSNAFLDSALLSE